MIELLAAILIGIYLVGVAVVSFSTMYVYKHDDTELTEKIRLNMEIDPVRVVLALTVLILAWPATLAYSLASQKRK